MLRLAILIMFIAACVDGDDDAPALPTCATISADCARAAFCNKAGECVCDPDGADGPLPPTHCTLETE